MFSSENDWYPKQAKLESIIREPECISEAINLAIQLHSIVHSSDINSSSTPTYTDEILSGLTDKHYSIMLSSDDRTIAWSIWHITRIEDLAINILVQNSNQVFNDEWRKRLNVDITDTGNAMTDEEVMLLSQSLNKEELRNYRNAVGIRTQEILRGLTGEDMKRSMLKTSLNRLLDEGGVTEHPDSIRIIDFWGKKDVAGILLMPITRHQIIHWDDNARIKNRIL